MLPVLVLYQSTSHLAKCTKILAHGFFLEDIVYSQAQYAIYYNAIKCTVYSTLKKKKNAQGTPAMSRAKSFESARDRVARNVKLWRDQRGLSQLSLSKQAGLSRTYLSRVENGVETVSVDNLEKLAIALCVDIAELLKPAP